jgi:DNA-binding response OmpR family regulator
MPASGLPAGCSLDYDAGVLTTAGGAQLHLTPREADLLLVVSRTGGRVATYEYIMAGMYGTDPDAPSQKILSVFACALNKKLRGRGLHLRTHWGRGYTVEAGERQP